MWIKCYVNTYRVIDHNSGAGWEKQAFNVRRQPENVGYTRDRRCRWLPVKEDAVQKDDNVGDVEHKPAYIVEHQKLVHLVNGTAERLVTSTESAILFPETTQLSLYIYFVKLWRRRNEDKSPLKWPLFPIARQKFFFSLLNSWQKT